MTDHYYTSNPASEHREQSIKTMLRGMEMNFTTDAGVFSRDYIDYGTRLLIETMELPPGAKILDVGCGYGPIGIAAAKLDPNHRVTMIDVNERAVELAERNAQMNDVRNVRVLISDLYEAVEERDYDAVLTNPPIRAGKQTVHAIFSGAREYLKEGGSLWVVIQKKQGAPSAFKKLQELYEDVEEITKDKGYRIFRATKKASP